MTTAGRTTSLVGRDREVAVLRDTVASAVAGHAQVVLVEGEPGIGKTRLVDTACQIAQSADFEVARGGCDDLVAARPFGALIDALGVAPASRDPDRVAIAALVDTHDAPDTSAVPGAPNPGLQYRVTEALGALVEKLAARSPFLLALDDLQWSDASTLGAIRSIAKRVETLPVLILGSSRAGHGVAELHRITDDLLRAGAVRLVLGPLDAASVASLVTEMLDERPTEALLARVHGASGNPLFVIEYVRSLGSATPDSGEATAALEFRLTVLRRLATLPGSTNDALRLASVLGSTFSVADLGVVSGKSIVDLAPALQQAVAAGLLEERGEQLGFRHMLVRDAIYEHIPAPLRRQLHREVGRALAGAGSDALTVAHHLGLGADAEDPEAVAWLRRAARDAASRSPAVAVELLERGRDLLGPTSPERDPLLAELAVVLAWSGRLGEAGALGVEVLERRPDPAIAGALRCGLVYALAWQGKPAEALRYATLAPDERITEWDAVLLRAEAAVASLLAFDFPGAAALGEAAVAEAERLGHDVALCHALTAQSWVALFAGKGDAVALAGRAVEIADRSATGEPHLAHPRFFLGQMSFGASLAEAEGVLRQGLKIAESLGLAWSLPLYHSRLGARGFIAGDWESAVAECEAALAVMDEVGMHVGAVAVTSAWLAAIQLHRDDLDAAERTLSAAMVRLADSGPQLGMGVLNWARAMLLDARGDREGALALLQAALDLYKAGGPGTDPWSRTAFVRLCAADGDHERAAAALPPFEQAQPNGPAVATAGDLRLRGIVEKDPDTIVRAVELYRQTDWSFDLTETCEDAGMVLHAAGRADEAVGFLNEALEGYERLGAERDIARVTALLRQLGVKRGARRRHVRATEGWESLTETEHKVVALVAQRLSNPEVADRLFISRHTVESHLKHIYRKLGLSSRLELAALAAQHAEERDV